MGADDWRVLDALATWKLVFSRVRCARRDKLVGMGFATAQRLYDDSYFYRITEQGAEAMRLRRAQMKKEEGK